jgi:hypothetical protein
VVIRGWGWSGKRGRCGARQIFAVIKQLYILMVVVTGIYSCNSKKSDLEAICRLWHYQFSGFDILIHLIA